MIRNVLKFRFLKYDVFLTHLERIVRIQKLLEITGS